MIHELNNFVRKIREDTGGLARLLFRVLMPGLIAHQALLLSLDNGELAPMSFSTLLIVFFALGPAQSV